MISKLPICHRGDSLGIAVVPEGIDLAVAEVAMLLYTTPDGPRVYGSTTGSGLRIEKGADRLVWNIPPEQTLPLDAGIATLEVTYTLPAEGLRRTLTEYLCTLHDAKIADRHE